MGKGHTTYIDGDKITGRILIEDTGVEIEFVDISVDVKGIINGSPVIFVDVYTTNGTHVGVELLRSV